MKRKQSNIFAVIVLGGLMACAPMARAEDSSAPATPPATPAATNGVPRQSRGAGLQALLDKLGLTPDQKEKTMTVLKDQRTQMSALRGDTTLSPEDIRAKRKDINEATDGKLKAIFTPDQYTQWLQLRKQMRGRGPGAGGAPVTPPSTPTPDAPKPGTNQN